MKNILQETDRRQIYKRLDVIQEYTAALWGRMTAGEMLCHVADQIRVALGEIQVTDQSDVISRTLMKHLVLLGFPPPKGKIKTFPEIERTEGRGTTPTTLDQDRQKVKDAVEAFLKADEQGLQAHSFFGWLDKEQWGRLVYLHLDYHLSQFGE